MTENTAETSNTATAETSNTATAETSNTATAETSNTATAETSNTATAETSNTATAETSNTATAETSNTATAETSNTATAETSNTATAETSNTATAETSNTATAETSNTATETGGTTATVETSNVTNTKNINEINFEDNKPWLAPHYPFSLEGHWQPWYDDRRDYNTNAPTYYDYLSNFNHLIKAITELLNRVARRNIKVEDTHCIDLTKIGDWIDEGNKCHSYSDVITLKAEVILSTYQKALTFDGNQYTLNNIISCLETGLYSPDYLPLLEHLATKLNQEIADRIEADKVLDAKIDKEIQDRKDADTNLQTQITKEITDRTNADTNLQTQITKEITDRTNADTNLQTQVDTLNSKVTELTTKVTTLTDALQKIVTNLFDGGNATSNDISTFTINNKIAVGNINLYGGTADGTTLIRTHSGNAENDVTIGQKE